MTRGLRRSLGAKLLVGELLVVVAGAATLLITALSIGPVIFRHHVREALGTIPADVARHLDEAFGESTLIALGIATATAAVTALVISWIVSRRVVDPIRGLEASARRIAAGAYTERVPDEGEDELAALAGSFNQMATSLEAAEQRRRQLLSDVAHELRTPLATVEAHVEGMADGVIAPDDQAWAAMRTEIGRLSRLGDDLQRVSRAEERQLDLRIERVGLHALAAAAVEAASPAYAAEGVALTNEVPGDAPAVAVDPDRLGEVVANLLDNALRHTPADGAVRVRGGRLGDAVELVVVDTGEGIDAEHLGRVFERFYRVDAARSRARGGSGIGLAIARALVEAHGGKIAVESPGRGQGTSFRITLPIAR